MRNRKNYPDSNDLEELLWRVEQALEDPEEEPAEEEYEDEYGDDFILEDYTPEDVQEDEPVVFQNYANGYGQPASQPRPVRREPGRPVRNENYYNERYYPAPERQGEPRLDPERWGQNVPRQEDYAVPAKKRRKKRRGCGCGCLTVLLMPVLVLAVVVGAVYFLIQPPKSEHSIGTRKDDTATILICGTDEDGTRTDTMMLMYLSGSEDRVSLLSLPRDSYTITSSGKAAKLNSAYGRNGTGEEGMEVLMDYVKDIIGYYPDGYILVDFTLVPQIVDIMGGVDFDVPMDMDVASVAIEEGYQHLSGKQLMTLLRFRKGYATADLGRVEVQREVLKACMDQWLTPAHIGSALEAVSLLENNSISTLDFGDYLWVGKTLLTSMGNFSNDTLPGYADYIGDVSYYLLDRDEIAELINSSYNPYKVTISPDDLDIAG